VKKILTAAAAAALLAVPAFAQTPSANPYEQQIRTIYAQLDSLPGSSAHQRQDLLQQAMAVKAEANRHGVTVDVPPKREAAASK
jgi:hypothetical protein